jgi:hypothetical protein
LLLYGERQRRSIKENVNRKFSHVPDMFFTFAAAHLVSAMYLIDGGRVFELLKRQGFKRLGKPIRAVLNVPLGAMTLGRYVLGVRNEQMTHGEFPHSRLEPELRRIGNNRRTREKYDSLFEELLETSRFLGKELEDLLRSRRPPQTP